jgi:hypothetical protein
VTSDLPLWPGKKLAFSTPQGWMSTRPDLLADLPRGKSGGPVHCGKWCPPDWGWPPVICTDHGDGYHAAALATIWGPRIIAVWLEGIEKGIGEAS